MESEVLMWQTLTVEGGYQGGVARKGRGMGVKVP
jgi:hypothetical protein